MAKHLRIIKTTGLVLLLGAAAVIVYAQANAPARSGPGNPPTLLDDRNIFLSGTLVLLLLGGAAALAANLMQSRNHIASTDLHHSSEWLLVTFAAKDDCLVRHTEINRTVEKIFSKLDTMGNDIAFIRGKMEQP